MKAYFEAMGIDPTTKSGKAKLAEAYNKAHDIRKFEIEMYWTRSTYLWTIQAAALAGFALVGSEISLGDLSFIRGSATYSETLFKCTVIFSICAFGLFSSYIWILLLLGAKHWQNNWERHVDALEDHVSGALYKTYPGKGISAPYSVSKLNLLMARFMLVLWIAISGAVFHFIISPESFIWFLGATGVAIIISPHFGKCFKMDDFPKGPESGDMTVLRRPAPKFSP